MFLYMNAHPCLQPPVWEAVIARVQQLSQRDTPQLNHKVNVAYAFKSGGTWFEEKHIKEHFKRNYRIEIDCG